MLLSLLLTVYMFPMFCTNVLKRKIILLVINVFVYIKH